MKKIGYERELSKIELKFRLINQKARVKKGARFMTKTPQYIVDYRKRAFMRMSLDLNRNTDADIIEFLESVDNKRGFIRQLIRDEMARKEIKSK